MMMIESVERNKRPASCQTNDRHSNQVMSSESAFNPADLALPTVEPINGYWLVEGKSKLTADHRLGTRWNLMDSWSRASMSY